MCNKDVNIIVGISTEPDNMVLGRNMMAGKHASILSEINNHHNTSNSNAEITQTDNEIITNSMNQTIQKENQNVEVFYSGSLDTQLAGKQIDFSVKTDQLELLLMRTRRTKTTNR